LSESQKKHQKQEERWLIRLEKPEQGQEPDIRYIKGIFINGSEHPISDTNYKKNHQERWTSA